jgi:hypothetical protein
MVDVGMMIAGVGVVALSLECIGAAWVLFAVGILLIKLA